MSITKTPTSMIDPNGATAGQVLTFNASTSAWGASSLSANGFTASLSSNGYTYLPNRIIMQWGTVTKNSGGEGIYTELLPISFPSQFFFIVGSVNGTIAANTDNDSSSVSKDGTSLSSYKVTIDGNTFSTSWFAIGC